ncbi:MAG: Re/Si-specific NAD(P)(+) transhydrogenase subunit alpha, partial [Bryobacteraceae bacterium]|nr:Re/Si-specific NAD(P)(+) transhydrogenase subunit alpha [Bryobacteraceae bacterium]
MVVGVPKETHPGERRVALTPAVMDSLKRAGLQLIVERGAGEQAGFPDAAYEAKGARAVGRDDVFAQADIVAQVRGLNAKEKQGEEDLARLRPGQVLVGMFDALWAGDELARLADAGVMAFALDLMPRISRAQAMDALSSMATVAGYKAVMLAAGRLPKMFPMLMTAAGTIPPARVFIIGAGVAGLQAIATARRLGAVVEAYDVRPAVKEQVESLGAKFVELPLETVGEDASGYAREQDEQFQRRQRELMARVVASSDVVIATASVPGRRAPLLITREMVAAMHPGSVIVDLAAERGGNCELTRPGEEVSFQGVTILGPVNLPATVPYDASQMYARNLAAFLAHLVKDGDLRLDP